MVSPEGNDLPLRDSSRYDFCSSIHLTFLVLCTTGVAEEGLQGLRWSDRPDGRCPGPVDAVRSGHGRCPRTTGALVLVLPRPGVLDDATKTGLRRLCRGVRRPPNDEAVRPLPGCTSTRCTTSAAYHAHVSNHLTVLSIFRYKYSVANNFMFHVLC
jgi:hypothetical protein